MNTAQPHSIAADETYKKVAHVVDAYSEILKTPQWKHRQERLAKLKSFCESLRGKERELIKLHFKELFTK